MKKIYLRIIVALCAVVVLAGVFFAAFFISASFGFNLRIEKDNLFNEMAGFGASSAWITQQLGAWADEDTQEEVIEALYGQSGMQLSVYRYNVGGGSAKLGEKVGYSQNERATESFFISENYVDLTSFADESNYDFSKDAGAVNIMLKAINKGYINKVVLFVNSPHYLLTHSKTTHGDYEYQNNLAEESYQAFADYLLIIAKNMHEIYLKDKNIKLYISPINEPQWRWGGDAIQEGCHYDPKELNETMNAVYAKLLLFNKEYNLDIRLEAFDSGSYLQKHNKKYFKEAEESLWFKDLDTLALHSYHKSTSIYYKNKFKNFSHNKLDKNIAMTEFCDLASGRDYSMKSALYMSKVIIRDLTYLEATEWGWWLGVSALDYDDGLVYWDFDHTTGTSAVSYSKRYYSMAQFSKFINPGDIRIGIKINRNIPTLTGLDIAAFLQPNGNITLVMVNSSKKNYAINLQDYEYSTVIVTSNTQNLKTTSKKGSKITLEPYSVTTLLINE